MWMLSTGAYQGASVGVAGSLRWLPFLSGPGRRDAAAILHNPLVVLDQTRKVLDSSLEFTFRFNHSSRPFHMSQGHFNIFLFISFGCVCKIWTAAGLVTRVGRDGLTLKRVLTR